MPHRTSQGDIALLGTPARTLFKEYWNQPEESEAVIRGGYYLTGDRAYRDARRATCGLWGARTTSSSLPSYRVGPFEVESALIQHPAVVESAVVPPHPTEDRGSVVKAFVVLGADHEPSIELAPRSRLPASNKTAPYKYPRKIEFIDELPEDDERQRSGRVELRQRELA